MKSYTNIPQSKKLAEKLPLRSADMHYERVYFEGKKSDWFVALGPPIKSDDIIPCWSLAALLSVLPSASLDSSDDHYFRLHCKEMFSEWHDNPVDATFEMVELLHKENLI